MYLNLFPHNFVIYFHLHLIFYYLLEWSISWITPIHMETNQSKSWETVTNNMIASHSTYPLPARQDLDITSHFWSNFIPLHHGLRGCQMPNILISTGVAVLVCSTACTISPMERKKMKWKYPMWLPDPPAHRTSVRDSNNLPNMNYWLTWEKEYLITSIFRHGYIDVKLDLSDFRNSQDFQKSKSVKIKFM